MRNIKRSILLILGMALSSNALYSSDQLSMSLSEQYSHIKQEPGICNFIAPGSWKSIGEESLPNKVIVLVKGEGGYELPPSLNLAVENVEMGLKKYLETIRDIHLSHGNTTWKKLGTLQTNAGPATLTQLERNSGWGRIRMIQAILMRNNTAYILTATAIADEFPKFYKEFFQAIQSLTVSEETFPGITTKRKEKLEEAYSSLAREWKKKRNKIENDFSGTSPDDLAKKTFEDKDFKEINWIPFITTLETEYSDMGIQWKKNVAKKVRDSLQKLL